MESSEWPKAIFYDSKTTLFDWNPVWIKACSDILARCEASVDNEEFQKTWLEFLVRLNCRHAFAEYRTFTDLLRESLAGAFKQFDIPSNPDDVKLMAGAWNEVQLFPETLSALAKQQEMTRVVIFSNVETEYLQMMVSKLHGFKPDFVGDMDQANALKPSPRAYYWVLKKIGLDVKDVLYCARPQWDVQAAMALGMKGVWLNRAQYRAGTKEALKGVKPDYEVADLHGVTKIIESLRKGGNR